MAFLRCAIFFLFLVQSSIVETARSDMLSNTPVDSKLLQDPYISLQNQVSEIAEVQKREISELQDQVTLLKKTIEHQNLRITSLEEKDRQSEKNIEEFTERQKKDMKKTENLKIRIEELERVFCEHVCTANICSEFIEIKLNCSTFVSNNEERLKTSKHSLEDHTFTGRKQSYIRKEGLLLPTDYPTTSGNLIAFYAYMSTILSAPSPGHVLVFDTIKTNLGDAYHPSTGVFIAPRSGYYVFTYTFRQWYAAVHSTELVVNQDVVGKAFLRTSETDDETVSVTVVVHASKGNDVFVRLHATPGGGDIKTDYHGWTTFAGWILN